MECGIFTSWPQCESWEAQNDRIGGLLDVRSAAITLLEDVTKSGRQHKVPWGSAVIFIVGASG